MGITASSKNEISEFLATNMHWKIHNDKLHRQYLFPDFTSAFSFMTGVAEIAEKMNHHPEWFNVYNKLTIELITHDVQAISSLDFELAIAIEKLFNESQ